MADEKDQETTPVEDKDKKEEKENEEEDVFSDIFGDENKGEQETETPEDEKPEKKEQKPPKKTPTVDEAIDTRITEAERRLERRADVNDFLNSDKGEMFRGYSEQIRKAALDPRFRSIPVSQLPGVVFSPAGYAKILSDARKKADEEAADSTSGVGTTTRLAIPDELKKIDPTTMDAKEFAQLVDNAKRGKYKIKKK